MIKSLCWLTKANRKEIDEKERNKDRNKEEKLKIKEDSSL